MKPEMGITTERDELATPTFVTMPDLTVTLPYVGWLPEFMKWSQTSGVDVRHLDFR